MRRTIALTITAAALLTGCSLEADATGPACATVKASGFPAEKAGVTVTTGTTSCDDDETLLPVTITNGTDRVLTVDLMLKLSRGQGEEQSTILVEEEIPGGKQLQETADIYVFGELAEADGPITATVKELTVGGPAPEPTEDIDAPDGDVDKPNRCNRKWYC